MNRTVIYGSQLFIGNFLLHFTAKLRLSFGNGTSLQRMSACFVENHAAKSAFYSYRHHAAFNITRAQHGKRLFGRFFPVTLRRKLLQKLHSQTGSIRSSSGLGFSVPACNGVDQHTGSYLSVLSQKSFAVRNQNLMIHIQKHSFYLADILMIIFSGKVGFLQIINFFLIADSRRNYADRMSVAKQPFPQINILLSVRPFQRIRNSGSA